MRGSVHTDRDVRTFAMKVLVATQCYVYGTLPRIFCLPGICFSL